MADLVVRSMALGMVGANCYFVYYNGSSECLIVDAPDETEKIIKAMADLGLKPIALLLTHSHFDHIGAAADLREKYGIPICCHEAEKEMLENPGLNLTTMVGEPVSITPDRIFADGETVKFSEYKFTVIHTPGHTQGGACYYFKEDNVLFCGDTLFKGTVGRCDFPTGNGRQLISSIREKLYILPDETLVYPGHNDSTTIGCEKKYNEYTLE